MTSPQRGTLTEIETAHPLGATTRPRSRQSLPNTIQLLKRSRYQPSVSPDRSQSPKRTPRTDSHHARSRSSSPHRNPPRGSQRRSVSPTPISQVGAQMVTPQFHTLSHLNTVCEPIVTRWLPGQVINHKPGYTQPDIHQSATRRFYSLVHSTAFHGTDTRRCSHECLRRYK